MKVSRGASQSQMPLHSPEKDNIHVAAVGVTLGCFIDPVQHLGDVHGLQAVIDGSVVPYVTPQRGSGCQHVVLSPADLSPKGGPDPLQEPSVSPTRLSIILTAALNLGFFCRQLQAAVNSFTCTCR